jgi:hypothetical protein
VDEETGSGARSLHTLWIKGLPADALEQGLIDFLEQHFEGQECEGERRTSCCASPPRVAWTVGPVVDLIGGCRVQLVWDVNQLGHNVRRRRNLTIKVNKLQVRNAPL